MIVNVDPYSTSFDENTHVMKFAAVAKGVMTIKNNLPVPATPAPAPATPAPRVVRLSMIEGGEEEDVVYEEEDAEDDDEEPEDEFVNALLDELSSMRTAVSAEGQDPRGEDEC